MNEYYITTDKLKDLCHKLNAGDKVYLSGKKNDNNRTVVTKYVTLASKNNLSLLEVELITGRTHQIRVHLASISHPLYADSLYGEKVEGESYYLCASKLEFTHPFFKKKILLG